jgi:hypothetical protein
MYSTPLQVDVEPFFISNITKPVFDPIPLRKQWLIKNVLSALFLPKMKN